MTKTSNALIVRYGLNIVWKIKNSNFNALTNLYLIHPLIEKELGKHKLLLLKVSMTQTYVNVLVVNMLKHADITKHRIWLKFFYLTVVGARLLQIWGFSKKRVLKCIRFCRSFTQQQRSKKKAKKKQHADENNPPKKPRGVSTRYRRFVIRVSKKAPKTTPYLIHTLVSKTLVNTKLLHKLNSVLDEVYMPADFNSNVALKYGRAKKLLERRQPRKKLITKKKQQNARPRIFKKKTRAAKRTKFSSWRFKKKRSETKAKILSIIYKRKFTFKYLHTQKKVATTKFNDSPNPCELKLTPRLSSVKCVKKTRVGLGFLFILRFKVTTNKRRRLTKKVRWFQYKIIKSVNDKVTKLRFFKKPKLRYNSTGKVIRVRKSLRRRRRLAKKTRKQTTSLKLKSKKSKLKKIYSTKSTALKRRYKKLTLKRIKPRSPFKNKIKLKSTNPTKLKYKSRTKNKHKSRVKVKYTNYQQKIYRGKTKLIIPFKRIKCGILFRLISVFIEFKVLKFYHRQICLSVSSAMAAVSKLHRLPFNLVKKTKHRPMFFKTLVFVFILAVKYQNARFIGSQVSHLLNLDKRHYRTLFTAVDVLKSIYSSRGSVLLGCILRVAGKLGGKLRKSKYQHKLGVVLQQKLVLVVKYDLSICYSRYGVFSVRVWLTYEN